MPDGSAARGMQGIQKRNGKLVMERWNEIRKTEM